MTGRKNDMADGMRENKDVINRRTLIGSIIIVIGIGMLLDNILDWFRLEYVWPVIIIMVGLYLVVKGAR